MGTTAATETCGVEGDGVSNVNNDIRRLQSILNDRRVPEHIKERLRRGLHVQVICISIDLEEWRRIEGEKAEAAAELHRHFDWGWRA